MTWMIYGATGYTGQLVVKEAVKRGHKPLIAGRNPEKLDVIARQHDLDYVAFRLDDEATIAEAIADVDVVYHVAGPFLYTSDPMIRACLATHTHYIDITGEIQVYQNTYSYDDAARKVGISLISGAGFDVVPSDCLAASVAAQVPGATHLQTAIFGAINASAGTVNSLLEMMHRSWYERRDGELVQGRFASETITLTLPNGKTRLAMSTPWGDLAVSYRSTGIPNITSYLQMPPAIVTAGRIGYPILKTLLTFDPLRSAIKDLINRYQKGPDKQTLHSNQAHIWAKARNSAGQSAEAWLVTPEPYLYTARVAILAVEQVLALNPIGALSPSQAFGHDFTFSVEGCERLEG